MLSLHTFPFDFVTGCLLFIIPFIYWSFHKQTGFHLLFLLVVSIYFNQLIKDFSLSAEPFSTLKSANKQLIFDLLYPNMWAQNLTIVLGALRFEKGKVKPTLIGLFVLAIIIVISTLTFPSSMASILSGIGFGLFIVVALYRQDEWLGQLLDRDRLLLMISVPLLLWLLHQTLLTSMACGYILGAGIGYHLEQIKIRMTISSVPLKRVMVSILGVVGLVIIELFYLMAPTNESITLISFVLLGFWIFYGVPFLAVKRKWYSSN